MSRNRRRTGKVYRIVYDGYYFGIQYSYPLIPLWYTAKSDNREQDLYITTRIEQALLWIRQLEQNKQPL